MAEMPSFDATAVLGKLRDLVGNTKRPSGGGSSWVSTLILIAAAVAGMAVWAWISQRRNRELAKLRHAVFVTQLKAEQEITDRLLADKAAGIDAAAAIDAAATQKLRVLASDIEAEEARYAADLQAIDRIRSWRDVDPGAR